MTIFSATLTPPLLPVLPLLFIGITIIPSAQCFGFGNIIRPLTSSQTAQLCESTTSIIGGPGIVTCSTNANEEAARRTRRRTTTSTRLFLADTTAAPPPPSIGEEDTIINTKNDENNKIDHHADDESPFRLLASLAATTLLQSDRRRDALGKDAGAQASSATNWVDEGSAFRFRNGLDKLSLFLPTSTEKGGGTRRNSRERQDEAIVWLRWLRSVPGPMVVDLSTEARMAANGTVSDAFLELLNSASSSGGEGGLNAISTDTEATKANATTMTAAIRAPPPLSPAKQRLIRQEFLNRLQCRLILLPSGQPLQSHLLEPTGSLIFGKLLYGGVTRYRLLPNSSSSSRSINGGSINNSNQDTPTIITGRRTGERTERKTTPSQIIPTWTQYGGTPRRYDAVDMGPAMILEWVLLPKVSVGVSGSGIGEGKNGNGNSVESTVQKGDMTLHRLGWNPDRMFDFLLEGSASESNDVNGNNNTNTSNNNMARIAGQSSTLQGKQRNEAFRSDFRSAVGGLGPQIDSIVRRVLDGRVIRPAEVDGKGNVLSFKEVAEANRNKNGSENDEDGSGLMGLDNASKQLSMAAMEAEELALLGLTPVRGLLLYGPPGCGKTALAREIARALCARAPKIVSAPELLDRWVGGSERLVRELFHDAEAELAACNGDPTKSALHVIVIDEIDAVFRKRSSAEDSGEATRSSTVNQILAKLDGVEAIPNVLMIGMTNRRELLDEALLRPGRLEVQIEIPLPQKEGRREILQIHFAALRNRGRLSQPLCCAIDGLPLPYNKDKTRAEQQLSSEDKVIVGRGRKRRALKRATSNIIDYISTGKKYVYDLADDSITGGFSGADLEGLVRCAGSIALSRARRDGGGVEALLITLDDVKEALREVKV